MKLTVAAIALFTAITLASPVPTTATQPLHCKEDEVVTRVCLPGTKLGPPINRCRAWCEKRHVVAEHKLDVKVLQSPAVSDIAPKDIPKAVKGHGTSGSEHKTVGSEGS